MDIEDHPLLYTVTNNLIFVKFIFYRFNNINLFTPHSPESKLQLTIELTILKQMKYVLSRQNFEILTIILFGVFFTTS